MARTLISWLNNACTLFFEFTRFFRRFGKKAGNKTARERLGHKAEEYTADILRSKGYSILTRNYTTKTGEVDIVAFKDGCVVFVEVRSRTGENGPEPHETVNFAKQKKIISAARAYRKKHIKTRDDLSFRFDVAGIRFNQKQQIVDVKYFENILSL